MPKRKLHEEIDKIETREDFSKFVLYIPEDYQNNHKKWENPKLSDFLEAMSAWSMIWMAIAPTLEKRFQKISLGKFLLK